MKRTKITRVAVDRLRINDGQLPWLPKNPRSWTQTDIDRMVKSIDEDPDFAEVRPVLAVPGEGKELIVFAHNLLTKAAMVRGDKTLPVAVFEPETEEDQETIRRLALKDNGSFGSWDTDILANEWNAEPWQLEDWGVPEWITGGAGKETGNGAGTSGAEGSAKSAKEDEGFDPEKGILVRCKPGDIWELGEHRLMCGDSTDLETVKTLMGGALADMVFTDPPYGVSYTDKNEFLNRIDNADRLVNPIENDNKSPEEMNAFWKKVFSNLADVTTDKAAYYVTSPQGGDLLLLLLAIRDTPWALKHTLIWNKNNHVLGRCDYNYKHEPIIYGWKKKGTHNFIGAGKFKTTVWDIPKPQRSEMHPTMKPIELVSNCILDVTKEGQRVVDLFGGSGTTLIACEQLGRKCFMMEIDPHYCDVILSRWEKLTGREATKIN